MGILEHFNKDSSFPRRRESRLTALDARLHGHDKVNRITTVLIALCLTLLILFAVSHLAQASQADLYELTGSVVGAGGTSVAGNYQADVIIGQTAVSQQSASSYGLGSGFWGGGTVVRIIEEMKIYLPMILR